MLTPKEHPFITAEYSKTLGLSPKVHGLMVCVDDDGRRWTLVTEDTAYLARLATRSDTETHVEQANFKLSAPGWPEDW